MTGAVRVGLNSGGNGTMDVEAGAVATSSTGQIGSAAGSTGEVNVTGTGSRWTMTSTLQIGQSGASGTGTLNVLNGGRVDASSFTGFNSATVQVDGTGSQLNLQGAPTTTLTMGATGANNRLDVTDGAALAAKGMNFSTVAGTGVAVNFSGTGTTVNATSITAGGAGSSNITVANQAVVNIVTGSTPSITLDGTGNPTLTISSGASVSQGDLVANTGQFTLGENASGTLLINGGGQLSTRFTVLGSNAGSNGAATVTGAGSTWTSRSLQIGFDGTASLEITNGGTVATTGSSTLGFSPGGSGTVLVSGAGSQWIFSVPPPLSGISNIRVGSGGTGSMRIEDGALVAAQGIGVGAARLDFLGSGNLQPGNGTLVVTGAGTRVDLNIGSFQSFDAGGDGGTGTIDVLAGAVVTVVGQGHFGQSSIYTGANPQQLLGTGTLTVDGVGSRVTYTQTLDIGEQATGILNVTNGGFVSNSDGYLGSFTNAVGSAGTGTATVTGAGSRWENSGFLRVGDQGTGTLNVTNGGFVSNTTAVIANAANSIGTATVDGAGSTWTSTGALTVGNLGTATLTISGGAAVNSGAVSINAASTLNIGAGAAAGTLNAPSVANAGTVRFNHTGTTTFAAAISGAGVVAKDAAGTTILTAANTYTGTTTINAGTLQLGAGAGGGATGAIVGNVTNNATLAFNRSNTLTYGSVISGGGAVTQIGGGTTVLTGDNTYGGGTTITAGTLQLGNNGTTGMIAGNVSNDGTLSFNRSNSAVFAGVISGTGNVVHDGTGTTSLTGISTYNGTTTINAGTLAVNGSIASSAVTVNAAGTLGGNGTVGATNVFGTVAPGNSIGTLNVVGSFTQSTGSTYVVEVAPGGGPGTSDLISVTGAPGTATIQAGATVSVMAAPGAYTTTTRYTIVTATGGVAGTYGTLIDNAPFLDFELNYDANNVYLDITRAAAMFSSVAQTPNQRAAATGIESLGAGNPVFNAIVPLDLANALRAFDLLSGEIHASVAGALLEDSRFIRNAVTGRLQSMTGTGAIFAPRLTALNFAEDGAETDTASLIFDGAALGYAPKQRKRVRDTMDRALPVKAQPAAPGLVYAAWGQTFGSWGSADGDGNAASLGRSTGGFISGLDVTLPGAGGDVWRAGLAGGYQYTSMNVGDRSSSARIDTYHLAAYGGRQVGPLGLRAGAGYSWHDIGTSRSIVFPGFADAPKASYDAGTAQVFGEVGYALSTRHVALEPFAALAYVKFRTGSFTEAGGAAALTGTGDTSKTTYSTLGLRAAAPLPWRDLSGLVVKTSAAWRHAFGTVTPTAELRFAAGMTPFVVAGTPIARDAAAIELGLEGTVARGATLGVAYTGQVAGHADDHGVTANYVQRF